MKWESLNVQGSMTQNWQLFALVSAKNGDKMRAIEEIRKMAQNVVVFALVSAKKGIILSARQLKMLFSVTLKNWRRRWTITWGFGRKRGHFCAFPFDFVDVFYRIRSWILFKNVSFLVQRKWLFLKQWNWDSGGRKQTSVLRILYDIWDVFCPSQEQAGIPKYAYSTGFNADCNAFFQFSHPKWAPIFCQFFRFLECKS